MSQDRIQRLQQFVDWSAQHITGDEKGQAQIFLDRLFQAFGQSGAIDVGGTLEMRLKNDDGGTSFADYVWKRPGDGVLIEMKKRGTDLARHLTQAKDYWWHLAPNRPQYVILCNFDELWIYDFNIQIDEPVDRLKLTELPQHYDPMAFLFPTMERPVFRNNRVEVTRKAADRLASVFGHMAHVRKVSRELAQRFILQILVALFAEDIDLLPRNFLTNLLADIKTPEDSYDLLGGLFDAMNDPVGTPAGRFKGIRYFNGGLFDQPAKLALDDDGIELAHLRQAAQENWAKVDPHIFGTLFQHSMDQPERHAFGAHYTAPIDIMKIVNPTIVEPWTQLIDAAKKPRQLADLLERLSMYQVLDPACGSGNFLYLAYRELKRLEIRIRERLRTEFPDFQATIYHVTARQFHGMDIISFAIELAKVTMMLARKLAIDELHIADEPPLPLDNLDANFHCTDALMHGEGIPSSLSGYGGTNEPLRYIPEWPRADVIIGNPPFLGAKRLKPERGPDYVNSLRELYPDIPGMADYCVYWLRRAHDQLPICTPDRPEAGRAGLVGTQNIRNNQSRVGGLDHIVKTGIIVEAVDNQPWSGEANVHVSIANWVKVADKVEGTLRVPSPSEAAPTPPAARPVDPAKLLIPSKKKLWSEVDPELVASAKTKARVIVSTPGKRGSVLADKSYELEFQWVSNIDSYLRGADQSLLAMAIAYNKDPQRAFQGVTPGYNVFVLEPHQREYFFSKAPKETVKLVKPYLIGRELVTDFGKPQRFIIDMNVDDILQLLRYPFFKKYLEKFLLPQVTRKAAEGPSKNTDMLKARKEHLNRWWTFWARRAELRNWMQNHRASSASRTQRWPFIFAFISTEIIPGDKLQLFSFDDDYSFGLLQSNAHMHWFKTRSSRLKNEADYNYSSASVFDTFPWPQSATKKQVHAIAAAGREIRRIRTQALQHMTGGLRALYRTLELPGTNPLKTAHAALDAAVLAAYGFDPKSDLLAQLLTLNLQVVANIADGTPVTAPGIPPSYGNPKDLITDDCIQP